MMRRILKQRILIDLEDKKHRILDAYSAQAINDSILKEQIEKIEDQESVARIDSGMGILEELAIYKL